MQQCVKISSLDYNIVALRDILAQSLVDIRLQSWALADKSYLILAYLEELPMKHFCGAKHKHFNFLVVPFHLTDHCLVIHLIQVPSPLLDRLDHLVQKSADFIWRSWRQNSGEIIITKKDERER